MISIELDKNVGEGLLHLDVVFENSVQIFRNILHDNIEVNLIRLKSQGLRQKGYIFSLSVKLVAKLDDVAMVKLLHDLKFSVLISLILEDLLDSNYFASFNDSCL